jgi:uncharacterized SAM-binding protein YcdF (DUF218 family)
MKPTARRRRVFRPRAAFRRVDRSIQTHARAEPVHADHRRRKPRLGAAAGLALLAAVVGLVLRFEVFPSTDEPDRVDAVVVLAGGGERLPAALELLGRGVAPVLVLDPDRPSWQALCGRTRPYRVLCYQPVPYSTRGEARAVTRFARERGWDSIAIVTSTYHVTRARMLFERCFDGRVAVVSAGWGGNPLYSAFNTLRDAAATVVALTARRGC